MSEPCEPSRPIKRIVVEQHFHVVTKRAVLVAWTMDPAFAEPGPYKFLLQRGRAANDDQWVDVATTVDQPWLLDQSPKLLPHDYSTYYRIIVTDGNGKQYTSQVAHSSSDWGHYDWRNVREILRKEEMLQRKRAGAEGWLLKRRAWGDQCPVCTDVDTGTVRDSHCSTCYGTGVVGGYYAPLPYMTTVDPTQRLKRLTADQGLTVATMLTVRALAWPSPEQNDVWVNAKTNVRYRIAADIVQAAVYRGVPLVLNLHLEELPNTNMVYDVPTP